MPPRSRGPSLPLLRQTLFSPTPPSSSTRTTNAPSPFICPSCLFTRTLFPPTNPRPFSTTASSRKKQSASSKSRRKAPDVSSPSKETHIPDNTTTQRRDSLTDPHDHSELQAAIDKTIVRLKDALVSTRDAGRVSPTMLESLPVELNVKGSDAKGGSNHKEKATLASLGVSVVPKGGRAMQVFVADASHLKPVYSAIQASPYSLTPSLPGAEDPNQLVITVPVPPVTAETRKQAAEEARKVAEKAGLEVRNARGDAQKRFRKMELERLVVVDEIHKGKKGMEDVAKRGQEDVRKVLDGALKWLER